MRQRKGERPRLGDLDVDRHLRDPDLKQRYVTTMFDLIAPKYDRFTRWFSYGMDRRWKRELRAEVASRVQPDGVVLDLACGTGDLTTSIAETSGARLAMGLDPSRKMMQNAYRRGKGVGRRVRLCLGNMMQLPVADESVALATVGYGLRNSPIVTRSLDEIRRVLRPGGWLVTLDFYQPRNVIWRRLFLGYLAVAGHIYGLLWHRDPAVYRYIGRSIRHFLSAEEFTRVLTGRGFLVDVVRRKLGGGIAIHVARRL